MPVDMNLIWLGVGLLLAPALAELAKVRSKADKGFSWLASGGVLYLLAAAFGNDFGFGLGSALSYGWVLFSVIGLIVTLIGALVILSSMLGK